MVWGRVPCPTIAQDISQLQYPVALSWRAARYRSTWNSNQQKTPRFVSYGHTDAIAKLCLEPSCATQGMTASSRLSNAPKMRVSPQPPSHKGTGVAWAHGARIRAGRDKATSLPPVGAERYGVKSASGGRGKVWGKERIRQARDGTELGVQPGEGRGATDDNEHLTLCDGHATGTGTKVQSTATVSDINKGPGKGHRSRSRVHLASSTVRSSCRRYEQGDQLVANNFKAIQALHAAQRQALMSKEGRALEATADVHLKEVPRAASYEGAAVPQQGPGQGGLATSCLDRQAVVASHVLRPPT